MCRLENCRYIPLKYSNCRSFFPCSSKLLLDRTRRRSFGSLTGWWSDDCSPESREIQAGAIFWSRPGLRWRRYLRQQRVCERDGTFWTDRVQPRRILFSCGHTKSIGGRYGTRPPPTRVQVVIFRASFSTLSHLVKVAV